LKPIIKGTANDGNALLGERANGLFGFFLGDKWHFNSFTGSTMR
jgi:hypothetical protein